MRVGRKPDVRREYYIQHFGLNLSPTHKKRVLSQYKMNQLDACADDDARKLILGITAFPKPKDSQVFPGSTDEKIIIRKQVYLRDKGRCTICERRVILERGFHYSMHLMHLKSKGSGGDWELDNLATGCADCHGKSHNCDGKPVTCKRGVK